MISSRRERTSSSLIKVHIDAFKLQIRVSVVGACRVDAMLITDNLPELGTNLVATLTTLDVDNFTHCGGMVN
jgi:hypothetical protein